MTVATSPAPTGRLSPPWTRQRLGFAVLLVVSVAAVVLSWRGIGLGVVPLFTGIGHIFHFLAQTVPPQFPNLSYAIKESLVTLCMAVVATAFAVVLAVPVGFLAARNTTPHPAVRWTARAVIVACRAMPSLIFAIIFVEALGVGVLPGILALAVHSVGMLGKLFAESIEESPPLPREAVTSTGATRLQAIVTAILPQIMPSVWSVSLYRLDINLFESVILGYVGAGGIGFLLEADMNELQFRAGVGIALVMFVLIAVMEMVSAVIRRSLIGLERPGAAGSATRRRARGAAGAGDAAASREVRPGSPSVVFDREQLRPPWTRERLQRLSFLVGAAVVLGLSFWDTGTAPWDPFLHFAQIWHVIMLYVPPNFSTARSELIDGTLVTLGVAVLATAIGFVIAVPVSLLAARNIASRWTARITRGVLVVMRAIPVLILAIVFIVSVGLGPEAGVFALGFGTVAVMSKLTADAFEGVPAMHREAVLSVGASRTQETATSVVLYSAPTLAANGLYMLDINFRSSAVLGILGAGGIGFLLEQSVVNLNYGTTGAIVISTFAVVVVIELVTNWVRKHLI